MNLPVPYAQKRKWNLGFFHFIFASRQLRVISNPWIQECIGSTLTSIKTSRKHSSMMLSCGNTKITSFHFSTMSTLMLKPMYSLIQNRDLLSNQTIWNALLPSCSKLCLMKCMTTCFVPLLLTLRIFFKLWFMWT